MQPRVAAQPPPWVRVHDEFPSLKGMNTPSYLSPSGIGEREGSDSQSSGNLGSE